LKIKRFFKAVKIFYQLGPDKILELRAENTKLREQAAHDPLTKLYNRRFFDEAGVREVEAARRYGRPLSIVLFDIDGFKQTNDTLGHLEGDKILQKLAEIITSHCRKSDFPFRWGGDEFLIMLSETTGVKAERFARRIVEELRAQNIYVSYGVVPWRNKKYSSLEEFIKEGDSRLYKHKQKKGFRTRA